MSELILSVEDLTVSFDGFKAVDNLNFYVEKDELRCVIGPNGAGKTTLARHDLRQDQAQLRDDPFQEPLPDTMIEYQITRAGVGRKFQNPSVYEDLTVFENLEISYPKKRGMLGSLFFKRDAGCRRKDRPGRGADLPARPARHKAACSAHGQKQWLEIGMLLMQDPELMLLDEPVAGMSASEREQTADLLNRISKGRSIVVIEHDMAFVRMIAHKVTVLHQGRLLAEGSMDQVQADERVIDVYLGH